MPYFVGGGEYRDTTFEEFVNPDAIEGPFQRYDDAYAAWRRRSIAHIDEAFVRYRIVRAKRAAEAERLARSA